MTKGRWLIPGHTTWPESELHLADAVDNADVIQGMAEKGTLAKLTVPDLKKYCEVHQLLKGGKKDDIIVRIKKHMGVE